MRNEHSKEYDILCLLDHLQHFLDFLGLPLPREIDSLRWLDYLRRRKVSDIENGAREVALLLLSP